MHLEAHAAIGWFIGQTVNGDRRFRAAVFLSAVLPDLDAVSYLWGYKAYERFHHITGHNIWVGFLLAGLAALWCKGHRIKAAIFSLLAFGSHFLGDYLLTVYPIQPFYPFSDYSIRSSLRMSLGHWINTTAVYAGLGGIVLLAFFIKRTPIEIFSANLDKRIINLFFRRRTKSCSICQKPCNETCSMCGKDVCVKHGKVVRGFVVKCGECKEKQGDPP